MFDKYWYRQREFQYIDGITGEQNAQFSNTVKNDLDQILSSNFAAGTRYSDEEEEDLPEIIIQDLN